MRQRCNSSHVNRMISSLPIVSRSLLMLFMATLLLLEGEVRCDSVGNGDHYMHGGKITKLNRGVKSKCLVTKDTNGDLLVHYTKGSDVATNGCKLDLIVGDNILLVFGVKNPKGPLKECLTDAGATHNDIARENAGDENLLPFTFSLRNKENGGSIIGTNGDCSNKGHCGARWGKCLKIVDYAVAFSRSGNSIVKFVEPISEPRLWYCSSASSSTGTAELEVMFTPGKPGWEVKNSGCGHNMDFKNVEAACHKPEALRQLALWEITDKDFKPRGGHKNLFTLHMLKQKLVQRHVQGQRLSREYLDHTKGPKCDMFIRLKKDFFSLLDDLETEPPPVVEGTGEPPVEETTTTSAEVTTEAPSGVSMVIIVAGVVGVIILLAVIGGAVWFFVLRGKGEEEQGMEMGMTGAGGTVTKTKAGTTVGATQAKTGGMTTVGGTQAKTGMGTTIGGATSKAAGTTKGGATSKAAGTTKGGATSKAAGTTKGGATSKKK